jgi:dTDP-4-dehydrorhamnose reductase
MRRPTSSTPMLLVGASGFLGSAWRRYLVSAGIDTIGCSRHGGAGLHALDLAKPAPAVIEHAAQAGCRDLIVVAGITRVDVCEQDAAASRAVNVDGTLALAELARSHGLRTVFTSSDYVFDGPGPHAADEAPHPLTAYGQQKADVEQALMAHDDNLVLRLSKLLAPGEDRCLLTDIARTWGRGDRYRAARDQRFNPTLRRDVIEVATTLVVSGASGLVHLCAPEVWSRWGIAQALASALGVDDALVGACDLNDLPGPARPVDTSMVPTAGLSPAAGWSSLASAIDELAGALGTPPHQASEVV